MSVRMAEPTALPSDTQLQAFRDSYAAILRELRKVIVGQEHVVQYVVWAVFLQGHVLLEGVPGLGKTLLMSNLGQVLGLSPSRVQFTPDLMPADIIGTRVIEQDERGNVRFSFEKGPVFTQVLLADEINRASPKTQSALLEAMQERRVTVGGVTHVLPEPFLVMATQNPLEQEGTYPLPEAQLDRFLFKVLVRFPTELELIDIAKRTVVGAHSPVAQKVVESPAQILGFTRMLRQIPVGNLTLQYAARMVLSTHPEHTAHPEQKMLEPRIAGWIRYGASPRGLQALVAAARMRAVLEGRVEVRRDDIAEVALPCLRHRVLLSFQAETEGITPDHVIEEVVKRAK
jgi:MoxR-like ATPase